jgi:hypothetical protein
MLVARSDKRRPGRSDPAIAAAVARVSTSALRAYVDMLSFPRHYIAEAHANRHARDLLLKCLRSFGYAPVLQGEFDNIVALPSAPGDRPLVLLGAHYDSVPGTPGADDNASAVAVCLEAARILKDDGAAAPLIVLFNREEDGLLGSRDFVAHLKADGKLRVAEAHVFEMVGYCVHAAGSQKFPPGLPVRTRDVGDFLALLAKRHSNAIAEQLISLAVTYLPDFPVAALKIYLGLEKHFGHLLRSDHAPFWDAGLPALMWTDTSEFRNPHYHRASDTPDTLDYTFLSQVTQLAVARTLTQPSGRR